MGDVSKNKTKAHEAKAKIIRQVGYIKRFCTLNNQQSTGTL